MGNRPSNHHFRPDLDLPHRDSATPIELDRDVFSRVATFLDVGELGCAELTSRDWYNWVRDNCDTNPAGTNAYGVLALNRQLPLPPGPNGQVNQPLPAAGGSYSHCGPFPRPGAAAGSWKEHVLGFVPPPPNSRRRKEAERILARAPRRFDSLVRSPGTDGMGAIALGQFGRVTALHSYDWKVDRVPPLNDETFQAIVDCCSNLWLLVVATPGAQVTTIDVRHCKKLHTLKVCSAENWANNPFVRTVIVSNCMKLSSLCLRNCPNLTRLEMLSCPGLQQVELHDCSGVTFLDFSGAGAVEVLDLDDCQGLSVLDLRNLHRLKCLRVQNCGRLQEIKMPGHDVDVRRVLLPRRMLTHA